MLQVTTTESVRLRTQQQVDAWRRTVPPRQITLASATADPHVDTAASPKDQDPSNLANTSPALATRTPINLLTPTSHEKKLEQHM